MLHLKQDLSFKGQVKPKDLPSVHSKGLRASQMSTAPSRSCLSFRHYLALKLGDTGYVGTPGGMATASEESIRPQS